MADTHFVRRESCPCCRSGEYALIYSCGFLEPPVREYLHSFYSDQGGRIEVEYLDGAEYILCECRTCGTIYQQEIPDDFLMRKLYEEWIDPSEAFNRHLQSDDLDYYMSYAQEVMMLIAFFETVPSKLKFFDFGMGWGNWCRMAKAFGCETYGTELSETRIRQASSYGIKVITWDEIPKYSFDFINADQVFEHIPSPLDTVEYLKESLSRRGIMKISVPNGTGMKGRLQMNDWTAPRGSRRSLNAVSPLEHINCFHSRSIKMMADIAGLPAS